MTKDAMELAKALAENEKLRAELREALEEKAWLAKCAREALEEKVWLAKELVDCRKFCDCLAGSDR